MFESIIAEPVIPLQYWSDFSVCPEEVEFNCAVHNSDYEAESSDVSRCEIVSSESSVRRLEPLESIRQTEVHYSAVSADNRSADDLSRFIRSPVKPDL